MLVRNDLFSVGGRITMPPEIAGFTPNRFTDTEIDSNAKLLGVRDPEVLLRDDYRIILTV